MRIPRRLPTYPYGDNEQLYFGWSNDVGIYWDGTSFILNPLTGSTMSITFTAARNILYGGTATTVDFTLKANITDVYPFITLFGNDYIDFSCKAASNFRFHNAATRCMTIDYAANVTTVRGGQTAGDDLKLKANGVEDYPYITLEGLSRVHIGCYNQLDLNFGATPVLGARFKLGGDNLGGSLHLKETTTPGAIADFGALYTKADNNLYFQDGAGTEYTVTIV